MFRDAYRRRRCIVPMAGFFQKDPKGKRYAISRRDGEPFGVAGIWENWRDPETSHWERTFAIITVPANELVARIHDRSLRYCRTNSSPGGFRTTMIPRDLLATPFPSEDLVVCEQRARRP